MDEKQYKWLNSPEGKAKHERWKGSSFAKKARASGEKLSQHLKKMAVRDKDGKVTHYKEAKENTMSEESEHDRAYRYGWSARKTGHPHTNNPHERDSDLHKAWAKGWKTHGGKAFQPFKDAKGKTMGEENKFDLPASYGGDYSVRKLYEEEQVAETFQSDMRKTRAKAYGEFRKKRTPEAKRKLKDADADVGMTRALYTYDKMNPKQRARSDKRTSEFIKSRKTKWEKANEEIDEAAKDRPFTKWAAKALYGKKGSSNLKKGACVTCGSTDQQFRDALSKKEWGISGMCQKCQDSVFSK